MSECKIESIRKIILAHFQIFLLMDLIITDVIIRTSNGIARSRTNQF